MLIDREQLESMKSVDITMIDRQNLVDINKVTIDGHLHGAKKMANYLGQIQNPYCFRCGDTPIKIRFMAESKTLTQSLGNYFSSLK